MSLKVFLYHLSSKVHLSLVTVIRPVSQEHGLLGYGGCSSSRVGCLAPANQLGCHWRCWQSGLTFGSIMSEETKSICDFWGSSLWQWRHTYSTYRVWRNTSRLNQTTRWWRTHWSLENDGGMLHLLLCSDSSFTHTHSLTCCRAAVCSMRCCCWAAYIWCRYWAAMLWGLWMACWITCVSQKHYVLSYTCFIL